MIDYRPARLNMVEGQLRTNKVTDAAVLAAFLEVPRELFVPASLRGIAYVDEDVPLGAGRFLMEPMVLARLLQLAAIGRNDRVLEIGAATGYATTLLSRLAKNVVAVESEPSLIGLARAHLAELTGVNVELIESRLAAGHPGRGPYDVVLIGGAVAAIPDAIVEQIAEGGRLVTVLKPGSETGRTAMGATAMGQAVLMTRVEGVLSHRPVFDAATPVMPGFQRAPAFVF